MKKIVVFLAIFVLFGCSGADVDIWRADRLISSSQNSYEAAEHLYERALKRLKAGRQKEQVRMKLAKLYFDRGEYEKAIGLLQGPGEPAAKRLLAKALYKNSDFTGALEVFNKVGDKGDAEYLYFYGLALEESNLYDQAVRIYSKIKGSSVFEQKAKTRITAINLISGKTAFAGVDEEVKRVIQDSPSADKYPEASGIYLLVDEGLYLTEDNRMVTDTHSVVKIFNDRGKEKFGEVVISYDSTYEKLELEYARTIKPDGSVVTVGDKNIRDVSLYLNYPLYSNARARIISMPEVAPGAVIEYKAKLTCNKLPNKKDFNFSYWLQTGEPILLQRCKVNIPSHRDLKYKIVNKEYNTFGYNMEPKVNIEGKRKIYSLEFTDVPQVLPEPSMPPLSRADAYVLFSTFESWQDIYAWWRELYKDKITPDEDIKAKVLELIKGKNTPEEKARAIYNFCAQDIRYVAVEYGDAGYEPHQAAEIFKNKYGDCKDKAILLISMLSVAGIEAYPVLISTFDSADIKEDSPTLMFNHAIAATRIGEELIFMDATGNTVQFSDLPLGDQDRLTLVFFKDRFELVKTPLFEPEHNRVLTTMKFKVNEDESIDAQRQVQTWGAFQQAQRFWLRFTMPILIEEGLKQRIRSIADNATLKDYEIKNVEDLDKQVVLKYSFRAPQYLKKAGQARILEQLGGIDTTGLIKDTRRFPIEFAGLSFNEGVIDIELPAHLKVKYLPSEIKKDTKWFSYESKYEILDKNVIRFYSTNRQKERLVTVQDYQDYKKAIEEMALSANQQVILEEVRRR